MERETEGETQEEPEGGSEAETQTEPEEETETEQETVVLIRNIRVKVPEGGRVYDGTDQIELTYEYESEGAKGDAREWIAYEARLNGTDVGIRDVIYRFRLSDAAPENCKLDVEQVSLQAEIIPKTLEVRIPDGRRTYGSAVEAEQIQLLGNVEVTGFIRDQNGREQIPKDFERPEVDVDRTQIGQWDPIYEKGKQKVYRNALVLKRTEEGTVAGNPSHNYCFPSAPGDKRCRNGDLLVIQGQIRQGKEYEVTGEEGNLTYGADGTLWVKEGSRLRVTPIEGGGYNRGADSGALTQDGLFSFSLEKRDGQGNLLADSQPVQIPYRIDRKAPEAAVEIQADRFFGGVYYGQEQAAILISVPPDDQSGLLSAEYFLAAGQEAAAREAGAETGGWCDCTQGARLELKEEGSYVIYVRTRDRAGNQAYVKSPQLVLDLSEPELAVEGVRDNSANSGSVKLKISCSDPYYKKGSLQAQITGANGGSAPAAVEKKEEAETAWIRYADFPKEKNADDRYTLKVWAEDLAGNRSEKTVRFSINRFGSVYALGEETARMLDSFYHRTAFPVVFLETNLDYVGEVQILCRKDGSVFSLERGQDYTAELEEEEGGWKQYRYTIPERFFSAEGTYEVLLLSKDRALNRSDSQTQEQSVRFAIDRTEPECMVTGIGKNQIYLSETVWACVEPRDNGALREARIYLDGKENVSYQARQIEGQGGLLKWKASKKECWQRLQIYVSDEAGNEFWTEEIPFYVAGASGEKDKIPPYLQTEKSAKQIAEEAQAHAAQGGKGTEEGKEEKEGGKGEEADEALEKTDGEKSLRNRILAQAGTGAALRRLVFAGCILTAAGLLMAAGVSWIRRKR